MTNKLYVSNVPIDATEEDLRSHFATCGGVLDVQIFVDRRTNVSRGLACVTMTSPAYAAAAMTRLDGSELRGIVLRVTDTREPARAAAKAKVVQQFRERQNMTYDLDCEGAALTIRIFEESAGSYRVEARASDAEGAEVISSSGTKKGEVLHDVLRAWNSAALRPASPLRRIDDAAVMQAMREVRAV